MRGDPAFLLTQGVGSLRVNGGESVTLSVRSRFEVFKRDSFTCGYCGRTPDDKGVKLEVDHITPRAAGGGDEMTNLVTSCWDCNHGKAAKSLDDKSPSLTVAMANTRERALQLAEYRKWQGTLDDVTGELVARIWDQWVESFGGTKTVDDEAHTTTWSVDGIGVPSKDALMRYIDEGVEVVTVLAVIDKVRRRWSVDRRLSELPPLGDRDVLRYFFGTLKRIQETPPQKAANDRFLEGVNWGVQAGIEDGTANENDRLRDLFVNHEAHGFETYADVVNALWPED